jgi:hypothetical protein
VLVTGTAFDTAAVMAVEVRVDNGTWRKAEGTVNWQYRWSVGKLSGKHTVEARSTDGTNYSPTESRTYEISPSKAEAARQGYAWMGGALVIVLVLAAAGLLWARKKGVTLSGVMAKLRPGKAGN